MRLVGGFVALVFAGGVAQAAPTVVYDSLGPAAYNLPSQPYQAQATSEFGDRVGFTAGSPRALQAVTVRLSNWARYSEYQSDPVYGANTAGFTQALTFNIYQSGSGASHGSLITSITSSFLVPWRPEGNCDTSYGTNFGWLAGDGRCYNGQASDVTFDFSSLGINLPDEIVFGLAFNTQSYGASPTGQGGPYNSLNFALSSAATVGTDVDSQAVFWNTSHQPFLTSGTAGTFGQDRDASATGWGGYVPAVQFVTADAVGDVPEPGSLALAALALVGLRWATQRKAAHAPRH